MTSLRRFSLVLILVIAILVLYLLFWPVSVSPQPWTPPVAPSLTGPYQQNALLSGVERLSVGDGFAPEDVAVASDGRIYAGFEDGRVMQLDADGTKAHVFANTGGRPLGLKFDSAGNLIVADSRRGLLSIDAKGIVSMLAASADGHMFLSTNDLDIAADGTIYFTDASQRFPISNYRADIVEHGDTGRLLAYDPKSKTTRTILSGLSFANGVAISSDQSFVLVAETGEYRIHRVWLSGPKAGQSEVFIENLPGFPDGLSSNGEGKFWVALVTPRDKTLDRLMPHPFLRKAVLRLPKVLQPAPKRFSFVIGLDVNGRVVDNLQNNSPDCYAQIANVVEHNGTLYFGSIGETTVGRFKLR